MEPIEDTESQKNVYLKYEYPTIYGKDKLGKTRVWMASVAFKPTYNADTNIRDAMSIIRHGIYGGKLQTDTRQYTEGKNIGKKNETTPLAQCSAEVEKKRKDKMEKEGYSETFPPESDSVQSTSSFSSSSSQPLSKSTIGEDTRKIFPMLANKYEPDKNTKKRTNIVYPCFLQPKLDGLRCVVYLNQSGEIVYQSRTGGYFNVLQHLDESIQQIFAKNPGLVLDGELYTQEIPFEELAGIIKRKTPDKHKIQYVQYHVYDVIVPATPFHKRLSILQTAIPTDDSLIKLVPTFVANSQEEFKEKFGEFVAQGYEGIMLRNTEGLYQENYRSNDLMKYKEFFEEEYPIVDYKEGSGRDAGTVIWECETPEGRRFGVRPRGTLEARKEWFRNAKSVVGKKLTVIYQELSEMGVPRFPVGKAIREGY